MTNRQLIRLITNYPHLYDSLDQGGYGMEIIYDNVLNDLRDLIADKMEEAAKDISYLARIEVLKIAEKVRNG